MFYVQMKINVYSSWHQISSKTNLEILFISKETVTLQQTCLKRLCFWWMDNRDPSSPIIEVPSCQSLNFRRAKLKTPIPLYFQDSVSFHIDLLYKSFPCLCKMMNIKYNPRWFFIFRYGQLFQKLHHNTSQSSPN